MENFRVINSDARTGLEILEDNSIQCTITSPPYFNLRKYSEGDQNEIGTERSIEEYISHIVDTFDVLRAKTRDDGLLFLNLGDTYIKGQLSGVPWRTALALSDAGWILRSDIIWKKPNAMPSSVKNRPTTEHEYVFMFSKTRKYFYNQDAIREPHVTFSENSKMKGGRGHFGKRGGTPEAGKNSGNANLHTARWDQAFHPKGRNRRTVWDIPLGKFRGAHFAVFPERLVEICLLAGSRKNDLICDPFTGSGTTGLVALRHERRFYGTELVPKYANMASDRLKAASSSARLF